MLRRPISRSFTFRLLSSGTVSTCAMLILGHASIVAQEPVLQPPVITGTDRVATDPAFNNAGSKTHDPSTCRECQNGASCVPAMTDYPAFQTTYGNPYRIMDCRKGECESSVVERWKRSMQASHWGYPEYFHRNTYGYAHRNAFANNIRDGAIERATLYLLDFYPEDSAYAHMLTPKGLEKLEKSICVSTNFGSPLRVEKSTRSDLNERRLKWLSEQTSVVQAGIPHESICLIAKPMGIQATEAIRSYQQGISASRSSGQAGSNQVVSPSSFPIVPSSGASTGSQIPR